jgi:hypothetical protein
VPKRFVLYGGTAVALRYGLFRRTSTTSPIGPFGREQLERAVPAIKGGQVLQQSKADVADLFHYSA